jgi:hypothetical protein
MVYGLRFTVYSLGPRGKGLDSRGERRGGDHGPVDLLHHPVVEDHNQRSVRLRAFIGPNGVSTKAEIAG